MRADHRAAAPARAAGAAIDVPQRPRALDAGAHSPRGCVERGAQLEIRDVAERPPWRDACVPERFGLPHVPDAGDKPLVEQSVTDRTGARLGTEALDHLVEGGRLFEDVGAEVREAATVLRELEHRPVPEHRLDLVAAQDEPGPPGTACALRLDAPAAGHAEMAPEHEPALEVEEQVLPDGLHALQRATGQALGEPLRRRPRMGRLDLDPLAGQHPQTVGGAVQRVAFRHTVSVVGATHRGP